MPPHPFLRNDTDRLMYHMAQADQNEDSARSLWSYVMGQVFTTAENYINTPEFYVPYQQDQVRIDWCTRRVMLEPNNQTLLVPCICLEGKPEKQTESQDSKADIALLRAAMVALTLVPKQKRLVAMRWLETKIMFYVVNQQAGQMQHWSEDYLDIDKDGDAVMGYFNRIKQYDLY